MNSQEVEDIYNTLQNIDKTLNEINTKLNGKSKISKTDSDNIEGIKYKIEMISGLLANHLKL